VSLQGLEGEHCLIGIEVCSTLSVRQKVTPIDLVARQGRLAATASGVMEFSFTGNCHETPVGGGLMAEYTADRDVAPLRFWQKHENCSC
jgi:hypothetical protein